MCFTCQNGAFSTNMAPKGIFVIAFFNFSTPKREKHEQTGKCIY